MRAKRKRRLRRALELLPLDDGLIMVLETTQKAGAIGYEKRWVLVTPQAMKEACEERMRPHDRRATAERWGGNQWGEGWVLYPGKRRWFELTQPPLATDAPLEAYEEIACAGRIKSRQGRGRAQGRIRDKV